MNQILYTGNLEKEKNKFTTINAKTKSNKILITFIFCIAIVTFTIPVFQGKVIGEDNISTENVLLGNLNEIQLEQEENEDTNSQEDINIAEDSKTEENTATTKDVTLSNGKSYQTIAILKIPSLGIEYPVLSSTSTELLKISLNKYWGANPNEVGNMCIVGHNYCNGQFFSNLNKIKNGAIVQITDMTGETLDYTVYHTEVVDPYDTACTSQLTDGKKEITLITCTNDGSQRFVVKARAN